MTNSRKLYFSHISFSAMATALLLTGTSTAASAQQELAQGTLTIVDDCPDGQATDDSGACFNVVKTHQMSVGSQEDVDRVLAENGWRLATPDELAKAYENLGLHTTSIYRLSDGTNAVPAQYPVGSILKRGVNFRSAAVPDFLVKGIFYVDASAPDASSLAAAAPGTSASPPPTDVILASSVIVTPNIGNCPAGQLDYLPEVAAIQCGPEVKFHETFLRFGSAQSDAMVAARERAWVLATPSELQANVSSGRLAPNKSGIAAGGNRVEATQDGTLNLNPNYVSRSDGFYYVEETAGNRVQTIPHRIQYGSPWKPTDGAPAPIPTGVNGLMASASGWQSIERPIVGNFWSSNIADQHPAKVLFGLGDAIILRRAARTMLQQKNKTSSDSDVEALLNAAQSDADQRYALASYLIGEAYEALITDNPAPEQLNFRRVFEAYMSYERYRVNGITYDAWREFNGRSQFSANESYGYSSPAANFLPVIPEVSTFQAQQTNPMQIGVEGSKAMINLLHPAILAGSADGASLNLGENGLDLAGIGVAAGLGGTLAVAAGSLAVVAATVTTVGTSAVPIATTAVTAAMTVTQTIPGVSYVVPNAAFLVSKNVIAAGASSSLGSSAAIGIGISLALAALISKSFADLAMSNALDAKLRTTLDAGPQPVNVYQLLNTNDAAQAQLNRSAVFGYVMKMLIADPAEKGLLSIEVPSS
ncbi:MAG: hypothetical protein ABJP90_14980 [Paracoccaceae bacterium]